MLSYTIPAECMCIHACLASRRALRVDAFCLFVVGQDHGSQEKGCAFDGSVDDTKPVAPEKGTYAESLCTAGRSL